jgi:NAD dependent epimerase/dehydratase family enzyme
MSWIGLGDLVRLIVWCLDQPTLPPVLNAVGPEPCSQADFARALGKVLRRPAFLPAPAWAVRLLFGQMGDETVLGDLRVTPEASLAAGFRFETPDLPSALARALGE